ncbi:MAG: ABC transporter permease [Planctomycetes bacterium]|nr:ABC transporter permease [Planctomycetota bacterium]
MSTLTTALAMARKDLRLYFRDRTGMALGFLLPIVLVVIFGFVMKVVNGGDSGPSRATLWVVDQDGSEASRAFVAALRSAETLRVRPAADEPAVDEARMRRDLADGELHHALLLPAGFGATVAKRELPELRMLRDPDRTLEQQLIAIGMMQAAIAALGPDFAEAFTTRMLERAGLPKEWRERTTALARGFAGGVRRLFEEKEAQASAKAPAAGSAEGVSVAAEPASPSLDPADFLGQLVPVVNEEFRPPERPRQLTFMLSHSVSGIGVMMLMFGLMACATQLIREREEGVLPRLLGAPSERAALLWGKYLFALLIGALQLALLFAVGGFVFEVDFLRDPVAFLVASFVILLAITSFGMLIAAWARTSKQAEGLSTLLILVMSAVGGAWFPLQAFDPPAAVQVAMRCTLTDWAIRTYQALFWHGHGLRDGDVQTNLAVLLGFTVAATVAARALFERRYVRAA